MQSRVVTATRSFNQAAQGFGSKRVAPAEVVKQSDAVRIGTHCHSVADRFVHSTDRHAI